MNNRYLIVFLIIFFPFSVFGDQSGLYLDEVVVSEKESYESENKPGLNTIITREDIERSSSLTLFDILEKEASISIRSDSGGDKFSVIDLRGMGETAGSNLLIILDEMVLNSSDMSGQGVSNLPLEMVDSVEIIRGSGVVKNGGGAVSGVIKIKTIKPEKDAALIGVRYGSNSLREKNLVLSHKDQFNSFMLGGSFFDNDGYRDNSFYKKNKADFSIENRSLKNIKLGVKGSLLSDEYGLPGSVSLDNLKDKKKRKKTDFPYDNGNTSRKKIQFSAEKSFDSIGKFKILRSYDYKDNKYIMGYSDLMPKEDQRDKISSVSKDLRLSLEKKTGNFSHELGFDWFFDDYVRDSKAQSLRKNGQLDSKDGWFNSIYKNEKLSLNFGYRYSSTRSRFREDLFFIQGDKIGDNCDEDYSNHGYEAGLGFAPFKIPLEFFSLITKTFRNPNIDELALSTGDIKAQKSLNYEAGVKYSHKNLLRSEISYFNLITSDEIYYGEDGKGGRFNRNYEDNTIRKGVDLKINIYPLSSLYFSLNASHIMAEFEDTKKEIPLVSQSFYSVFAEYEAFKNLFISAQYFWYSEKKQGGDIKGNLKKIPSYSIVDGSISYRLKDLSLYLRVNNIFNELYTTSSYDNSCYPMAEREIIAGCKWSF